MMRHAVLLSALALLLALAAPTRACRPRTAAAVTHGGRALGEVAVPDGPILQGVRHEEGGGDAGGQPTADAERVSLRPSNAASLRETVANGARYAIAYHGGQVVDHPITVHYLWYGNWSAASAAPAVVDHFTRNLGGSAWWATTAPYVDARGKSPSPSVSMGAVAFDAYSQGAVVSDDAIAAAVVRAIARGALPDDPRGVYMVLGSADVDATSGFCTAYCGFHKVATLPSGAHRLYGYVGDPRRCGLGCAMQTVGPNGDSPADGMVSIIAHELAEVVTDPYADAWYDAAGLENTDKCIWVFGETYLAPNGATANMKLGGRDYLVQANWKLDQFGGGRCSVK